MHGTPTSWRKSARVTASLSGELALVDTPPFKHESCTYSKYPYLLTITAKLSSDRSGNGICCAMRKQEQ